MAKSALLEVKEQNLLDVLRGFLRDILKSEDVSAVLAPWQLPMKNMVMPTLIKDPEQLDRVDPLSPAFPMNSAKIVSRLTRRPSGGCIAAVMRPCEIRAFIELVKLKQGRTDDLLIIGIDCLGAYSNRDYFQWVGEDIEASTMQFYTRVLSSEASTGDDVDLAPACRACEMPEPQGADIAIGIYGVETATSMLIKAQTEKGEAMLATLRLPSTAEPPGRKKALKTLVEERTAVRDKMFEETENATNSIEKLTSYLANCVNCYNCRVACPVCYCRECVFVTDVFDHEPSQYLRWAAKKGMVKMPTDTVFYHITRLAHMSTACVGCGQCSNACPNDIPVMELFRAVSCHTQKAFDYVPGRSLEESPPLSEFREDEFDEVVGLI